MGSPANGKYFIQLATDRKPLIGVSGGAAAVLAPVITDARDNIVSPSNGFRSAPTTPVSGQHLKFTLSSFLM